MTFTIGKAPANMPSDLWLIKLLRDHIATCDNIINDPKYGVGAKMYARQSQYQAFRRITDTQLANLSR